MSWKTLAATAALALTASLTPALAQDERMPLLRVYIDTPYFYEFMAVPQGEPGDAEQKLDVYIEGKEVGESQVTYHCADHSFEETEVVVEWTGQSHDFLPAALMAFAGLYC